MGETMRIRRSPVRRAGESAFGLLLVGRNVLLLGVVLLLLAAGVWSSWNTAQHVMLTKGRERGTVTIARCDAERCTGSFAPADDAGTERPRVSIDKSVTHRTGERLLVAVKPGTNEVVRTGWAGVLYAWVPLAGAFLLAALVMAGGLRMRRTAWAIALLGLAQLGVTFVLL
ncbi:hypothetical protein [Streptomyces sp. NPDC051776]|uniref:hypothetical protein n=1 Tax=Streptomyces sp. NPDC051776 TaxID=3155414 RepID=UPI00343EC767